MPVPASTISRENVSCPSCCAHLGAGAEACPVCGYSASVVVEKFTFDAPPLQDLLDVEGVAAADRQGVEAAIADFCGRFPQLAVSVCLLRLQEGVNLREFGHWMINASPLAEGETPEARRRTILLIMDLSSGDAALTLGYDLEVLIGENPARTALETAAPHLAAGRFREGTETFLEAVSSVLGHTTRGLAQMNLLP